MDINKTLNNSVEIIINNNNTKMRDKELNIAIRNDINDKFLENISEKKQLDNKHTNYINQIQNMLELKRLTNYRSTNTRGKKKVTTQSNEDARTIKHQ